MYLSFYIFVPDWQSQLQNPSGKVAAAKDGIIAAEKEVFGAADHSNFDDFFIGSDTNATHVAMMDAVGATERPVFIVVDTANQMGIGFLQGNQITKKNVKQLASNAWRLTPNGSGGYTTSDGQGVTPEELQAGNGLAGGTGTGSCPPWLPDALCGCPDWLPKFLCGKGGILWIILCIVAALIIWKQLKK